MSYKVTMRNEAVKYEAPGHFECLTTRLHNPADVNEGTIVNGLSHFLPNGGANMAPAKFEMIYYIIEGEMTVTLKNEDGTESEYVLKAGDSVHFGPGTERACKNTGVVSSQMLTIMIKPQA
ncbi:MAG: cupin domain-containing protein [Lachnospiraceae bacterium]|jgi:mannose-6-phosphate isomerase-like protein (cupin superfamily)|nr:cupin domain-containing protein [Lachnospiraceae bacterium]